MTRIDRFYDQFRVTRFGRIVTHPMFLFATSVMSILALITALYALYGLSQQNGRTAAIASRTATAASLRATAAFQQSQESQAKSAKAQAAALEVARQAFCKIIVLNAGGNPPPTTARGFAFQAAYKELGKSPFLHCFDGKS